MWYCVMLFLGCYHWMFILLPLSFSSQVTWEAVTGSSAFEGPQTDTVNGMIYTEGSYVITNLIRLTTYSVMVHGVNSNGIGMDSDPATITTTATCELEKRGGLVPWVKGGVSALGKGWLSALGRGVWLVGGVLVSGLRVTE